MPRCSACGNAGVRQEDVVLARNRTGRWVTLCRPCHERGVSPENLSPLASSAGFRVVEVSGGSLAAAPAPDPFEPVAKAIAILRAASPHISSIGSSSEQRQHKRQDMRLTLPFRLMRDDAVHEGQLLDVSQGGLRLITRRPLTRGQVVQFETQSLPLPPALLAMLRESAEVRRVTPREGDSFEVGVRFVQRAVAKGANRRRHRRYLCAMSAFYQRPGSILTEFGRVEDLSQGGLQMRVDEAPERDERVTLYLRGDSGPFIKNDLVGVMEVKRVLSRGAEFEVGCQFLETRVTPRLTPPPGS